VRGWTSTTAKIVRTSVRARRSWSTRSTASIRYWCGSSAGRASLAWPRARWEAYAKDYRLFFSFLWSRGRRWHEADPDDLLDWEAWRRRDRSHGPRISGSKWQRELAALRLLYEWALARGHIDRSPVLVHTVRLRNGSSVDVADQAPRDVRSSNVKWLTPRTYRLWRDVGLLGYDADQKPDDTWRGRNDARNAAFADLMFSSGLRLREGGCLLTLEVPEAVAGHRYYEGAVAAAVAKRRERMFYVSASALARVSSYAATTRRLAIRAAQRHGRYERMPGRLIVTKVNLGATRRLTWRDEHGRTGTVAVNAIGPSERMRLLAVGEHGGLEPLWLWLTEAGMPMAYPSWEKVFDAADVRVAATFAEADRRDGRHRTPVTCNPHMLRHSMALYMLVVLHQALDRRFGLTAAERNHFRHVYGDPWMMVRDLVGHRSEQTTRMIYLEPLNGLQLRSMLDHDEDLETLLSRVAAASRLVMDVDLGEKAG